MGCDNALVARLQHHQKTQRNFSDMTTVDCDAIVAAIHALGETLAVIAIHLGPSPAREVHFSGGEQQDDA